MLGQVHAQGRQGILEPAAHGDARLKVDDDAELVFIGIDLIGGNSGKGVHELEQAFVALPNTEN